MQEYICHETAEYATIEFKEGTIVPKNCSMVSEITGCLANFEQIDEENDI